MSPYDCPSLFTILPFIEYEFGIWHPMGGCHALMTGLADVAREMGVEIVTGSPVERITFEGRRATGVVVGGEHHRHDHVVVNADAAWAIKNLIPADLRPRLTDAHMDSRKYSCSTYMMYLGVEGAVDLPHHTIYVSSGYKQNLDDISKGGRLSDDPSVYVCNPSVTDATLAPDGHSSVYVLVPTPNCKSGIDWARADGTLREQALTQIETKLGVRDIRDRIRAEERFTPSDWRASNINFGATFNLSHTLGQMLHKRPHHRLQDLDGVWMVGGGTHPGSGLPVIFLSAQITSRMLAQELGVSYAGDRVPATPLRRRATDPIPSVVHEPVAVG
jgi:phytoene desaturase